MRKKIFLILFIGIGAFTVVTTSELIFFFRKERAHLIDQQVEVLATSLLASGIFESRFETVQSQVSQALGTREMVAFLSVYDHLLNLRFRNPNAQILFGTKIIEPREKWMTMVAGDHRIRLLNLRTQAGGSWIQVGMLIDQENSEWESLAARAFIIVSALLIGVAIASFFLSRALLRPISELAIDLRHFSRDLEERKTPEEIFSKWINTTNDKDPFAELLSSLIEMRSRLVGRLKMNDATLSQMAHELKTPLAVIRVGAESLLLETKEETTKTQLAELLSEVDRLNATISSFLNWSRFHQTEFAALEKAAVSTADVLYEVMTSLETLYPNRIVRAGISDFPIEAYRPHVEQVFVNLLSNSLKYSSSPTSVSLQEGIFKIKDSGSGIPEKVLARIGEPFNASATGTGLGLAWVKTLCDRNGWGFLVSSSNQGTSVEINFKSKVFQN